MKQKINSIKKIVKQNVIEFAEDFKTRHIKEKNNPEGTINKKIHNVFVKELSKDILYYTALVRSFDSSLGNMLEKLAISVAKLSYEVSREIQGVLYEKQTQEIAKILDNYKSRKKLPEKRDYQILRSLGKGDSFSKKHESDYYLKDEKKALFS